MLSDKQTQDAAERIVKSLHDELPSAELYELGAILLSSGCFLVANAIPDLWPRLRGTAELAHQLLLNKEHGKAQHGNDHSPATDS